MSDGKIFKVGKGAATFSVNSDGTCTIGAATVATTAQLPTVPVADNVEKIADPAATTDEAVATALNLLIDALVDAGLMEAEEEGGEE